MFNFRDNSSHHVETIQKCTNPKNSYNTLHKLENFRSNIHQKFHVNFAHKPSYMSAKLPLYNFDLAVPYFAQGGAAWFDEKILKNHQFPVVEAGKLS